MGLVAFFFLSGLCVCVCVSHWFCLSGEPRLTQGGRLEQTTQRMAVRVVSRGGRQGVPAGQGGVSEGHRALLSRQL